MQGGGRGAERSRSDSSPDESAGPRNEPAPDEPAPMSQPLKRLVFAGEAIVDLLMSAPAPPERGGDMLAGIRRH